MEKTFNLMRDWTVRLAVGLLIFGNGIVLGAILEAKLSFAEHGGDMATWIGSVGTIVIGLAAIIVPLEWQRRSAAAEFEERTAHPRHNLVEQLWTVNNTIGDIVNALKVVSEGDEISLEHLRAIEFASTPINIEQWREWSQELGKEGIKVSARLKVIDLLWNQQLTATIKDVPSARALYPENSLYIVSDVAIVRSMIGLGILTMQQVKPLIEACGEAISRGRLID